ncbi:M15 family metallopeptidase [Microbulbifer harenosus]|uniref:D-alanyl-D-alanine dipeptidase n=1 Tax=Microbulbifer harenosus TaxID=2576840 RepID=A0ABY2UGT5_9GAMM|nr:M15 family metallopeptidase [Microbulbifer harenosus]TLM76870.1 D-alanyl-D-alanine dipeptidase [Microbulbifer harenosus]
MEIIELSDKRVRDLPVFDNGECLIDLKEVDELLYGEPPESADTEPDYHFLRESVVISLVRAQKKLPDGWKFRVYEGYRNPSFQNKLFEEQLGRIEESWPEWSSRKIYEYASRLVSPTKSWDGERVVSPHSTGGAVDVEIIDADNCVIDFGMEIRDWFKVDPRICTTAAEGISSSARRNRALLKRVLEDQGLVNYAREWWHFSYGDQYWAFLSGRQYAIYDEV